MLLMSEKPIAKTQEAMRISHSALTRILRYWVKEAVDPSMIYLVAGKMSLA